MLRYLENCLTRPTAISIAIINKLSRRKLGIMCHLGQSLTRRQHSPLKPATYKIVALCLFVSLNRHHRLHSYQSALSLLYCGFRSMHCNTQHFGCNPKHAFTLYTSAHYIEQISHVPKTANDTISTRQSGDIVPKS